MSKVQILPDILASQVAAGEVVERPASVVKELVENSLDAGARRIEVRIDRGGIALIRVLDDGCGMERADALACLERHATSKIRKSEDLESILTYGFRGEAIPSIASVSRFRLTTREEGAIAGTEVAVEGGKMAEVRDSGEAPGTQIEVRSLFFNVPARKKFLKTETTEFSHIERQVRLQAIAHPAVAFTLVHNGRVCFQVPSTGQLLDRIRGLIGEETSSQLIPIKGETDRGGGIGITGFIGEPGMTRSIRSHQICYLNFRPIESPIVSQALREGYRGSMARGHHPVTFLFLEINPAMVDVNVHPAKREVRFSDGASVQEALTAAVSLAIDEWRDRKFGLGRPLHSTKKDQVDLAAGETNDAGESRAIPEGDRRSNADGDVPVSAKDVNTTRANAKTEDSILRPRPEQGELRRIILNDTDGTGPATEQERTGVEEIHSNTKKSDSGDSDEASGPGRYRYLGPLAARYILWESKDGLVVMDRRAAWERVMFEDLHRRALEHAPASQPLLIPATIELEPAEHALLIQQATALADMGIGVEDFGSNTIKLESLPAVWPTDSPEETVRELIADLDAGSQRAAGGAGVRTGRRLTTDQIAASVARQSARILGPGRRAAAGETSSGGEERDGAVKLLSDLLSCEMPYCCPEGKPTLVQMSHSELDRKFGR